TLRCKSKGGLLIKSLSAFRMSRNREITSIRFQNADAIASEGQAQAVIRDGFQFKILLILDILSNPLKSFSSEIAHQVRPKSPIHSVVLILSLEKLTRFQGPIVQGGIYDRNKLR